MVVKALCLTFIFSPNLINMITPKIPYTQITLSGLVTLADRTITAVNNRHPEQPFFVKSISKLDAARVKASGAINSDTKLAGTKSVTQSDNDRDNSADSLKAHIKAGLKRNNVTYREACERLYEIFEKNNLALSDLPYDEESAALVSLFADLDMPQAVTDLATVNATEWLEELKADQSAFKAAVLVRSEEKVTKQVLTDAEAESLIIPALKSFYKVTDVAEENELVEGASETIAQLNAIIAEIVTAHRR